MYKHIFKFEADGVAKGHLHIYTPDRVHKVRLSRTIRANDCREVLERPNRLCTMIGFEVIHLYTHESTHACPAVLRSCSLFVV